MSGKEQDIFTLKLSIPEMSAVHVALHGALRDMEVAGENAYTNALQAAVSKVHKAVPELGVLCSLLERPIANQEGN